MKNKELIKLIHIYIKTKQKNDNILINLLINLYYIERTLNEFRIINFICRESK